MHNDHPISHSYIRYLLHISGKFQYNQKVWGLRRRSLCRVGEMWGRFNKRSGPNPNLSSRWASFPFTRILCRAYGPGPYCTAHEGWQTSPSPVTAFFYRDRAWSPVFSLWTLASTACLFLYRQPITVDVLVHHLSALDL